MKIKVRAFGELRKVLGDQTMMDLGPRAKLKDLVFKLGEKGRKPKKGYIGNYDVNTIMVLVNGHNIRTLKGLETPLSDGYTVVLLPMSLGG